MQIITFGYCCKKSKKNHENAVQAAKNCNIENEVKNIKDYSDIISYNILNTPAIMIDNEVVSEGAVLKVEQIEKLINSRK